MQADQTNEGLVLSFLAESGDEFIPGEVLLGKLGLSSAGLFRQVEKLRAKGYRIETSRARGYRLVEIPDRVSALELEPLLGTRELGRTMLYRDELPSTSEAAFAQAQEGVPHGYLVVADRQTKGRGRRGRTWVSPPSSNLYLSLVLRPELPPTRAPELTLVAAVAVAEAIQDAGADARIKWPNDVEIGGRKVAGILTELSAEKDLTQFVVLGIGVNLNLTEADVPEELKGIATSVRLARGSSVPRALFCAALLSRLEEWLDRHEDEGFEAVRERWTELSSTVGAKVRVRQESGDVEGEATGIDADGALLVKTATGTARIVAGDVETLRPLR